MTEDVKEVYRVSVKSMAVNLFLFASKLVFGLIIRSVSLVSDAFHSLSDILSTIVVMLGVKMSAKPEDTCHPYGHEKIETVVAFLLGIMLAGIGLGIGYEGILRAASPVPMIQSPVLNAIAAFTALLSIASKEWMYRFTIRCANKLNCGALRADAWHHRADAFSSIGSLVGVIGLWMGYRIIDTIACVVIAVFICKAAYDIISDSCRRLVDGRVSDGVVEHIRKLALSYPQVLGIDVIKARSYGSKVYVDLEITMDKDLSLEQSHHVASLLHDAVEARIANIKHCMIHVNPSGLSGHHHI